MMGKEKIETLEIIDFDHSHDKAKMQYFNSSGESGIMTGQINGNDFQINGDGLKFVGTINNESTEVLGKWFIKLENNGWKEFIELKLVKQN